MNGKKLKNKWVRATTNLPTTLLGGLSHHPGRFVIEVELRQPIFHL